VSAERNRLADDRGASAVEFALLAPMLLIFLFGIFQLGLALHYGANVRWALENNARTLLLTPDTTQTQLKTAMLANLSDVPNTGSLAVTLTTDNTDPSAKMLKATSAYTYPLSIPMLPSVDLTFNANVTVPAP